MFPSTDRSLCCCNLVEPTLKPQQHLDDCVLQFMDPSLPKPSSDDFHDCSSGNASPSEDHGSAKRKKHRESMARLRQTWRTSLARLQREETQLQSVLRRTLVSTAHTDENPMHPLEVLRQSYCTLVQEQLQLQQERVNLEATQAHREKYERLLERELERARIFRAITSTIDEES